MWVFKIPDFFFFLLSRCNFKINIFSFYHFPTDYIKSSMRLKDFGSKQCTHTVSPGDPSFLFRWQWWRFSCKQLKITDAVCEHAAPQNLSTGRTLACNKEQKKKSCWLYFPLFFQSFPVILLIKKRVDESLNPVTNEENNNKKSLCSYSDDRALLPRQHLIPVTWSWWMDDVRRKWWWWERREADPVTFYFTATSNLYWFSE